MNYLFTNYVNQFKSSFDFSGKASRKEYFSFVVAHFILTMLIAIFAPLLLGIYTLLIFFANLSVLIRRFRDAGVSPWLILLVIPTYIVIFFKTK